MLLNRSVADLLAAALVLLFAMAVHEFAHGYIALRMGDTTARDAGKVTLNPFVNINWVGFLMWVVVGFGILGSAPVNKYRMRDPKWGYVFAVAAGPLSNLILAALIAIPWRLGLIPIEQSNARAIIPTVFDIFLAGMTLNIALFLFNLLPFPGFDGWHILRELAPLEVGRFMVRYEREFTFAFFALLALAYLRIFDVFSVIIGPTRQAIFTLLLGVG